MFVAAIFLDLLFLCVCVLCSVRIQPIGLVERIQAIAQNMSDMAVRVEQILQRSMANSRGTDTRAAVVGDTADFRIYESNIVHIDTDTF